MFYKALIQKDDGHQYLIRYHESGRLFYSNIIWDEKTDGDMPAVDKAKLGGYSKSGNSLALDDSLATTKQAELNSKETKRSSKRTKCSAAKALLRSKYKADTLDADVKALVEALCIQE